ncbi:alpha/beta hydrolase [Catenulispora subtropica]|uniref:Alpha/beta hydrolase n=1 Tax=Catenulispora subtropica TaxID=450798 RepID=A0ABN2QI45_9ACTN
MSLHAAAVSPGSSIRWLELPGAEPARVYLHGLGSSSAHYFAEVAGSDGLRGRRSLLLDLLGHGISDRPTSAGYTMSEHADWVARALRSAGVSGAQVIAHSMGGAVATLLAVRHPDLVASLVLVDSNLDPAPEIPAQGSSQIARYGETVFLRGGGYEETLERVGPEWAATMRLAGPEALYRSAASLAKFTGREILKSLAIPRTYLYPAADGPLEGADALITAGVRIIAMPDCGHNIMLDDPAGFVAEVLAAEASAAPAPAPAPAAAPAAALTSTAPTPAPASPPASEPRITA